MLYWTNYTGHEPDIKGKRKKVDNTIYTFDIETTSFLYLNNRIYNSLEYLNMSKKEQQDAEKHSCM